MKKVSADGFEILTTQYFCSLTSYETIVETFASGIFSKPGIIVAFLGAPSFIDAFIPPP